MFRDLLRRDLVAGASASPQFSLAQSRELKTRPSVSAVARSLARRAPPRARRRPLLSGNGARRPRCRAARRARRGMSADRHPMPRAAVPRRRAASPVYAAPCSDTPLLVRIIDRSIPLQTRWATARATKRPRPASAGSGRRSARAACSASAGRCGSAPSKFGRISGAGRHDLSSARADTSCAGDEDAAMQGGRNARVEGGESGLVPRCEDWR